jgi:hypothetical protein
MQNYGHSEDENLQLPLERELNRSYIKNQRIFMVNITMQ